MLNKKILYSIIVVCLLFANNSMIKANGGSIYSRYGLGDIYLENSAMKLSMGGLGTSIFSPKYINAVNPASLSALNSTLFNINLDSRLLHVSDRENSANYLDFKFQGFNIAFSIYDSLGIGFILGMSPYSLVDYEVDNGNVSKGNYTFNERYEGTGGLSKIYFGLSFTLPFDFSIGATFNYYTGDIQYQTANEYADSLGLYNTLFIAENKYKGLGTTLGFESPDFAKLFNLNKFSNFRIGAFYEIAGSMNTDSSIVAVTSIGSKSFNKEDFLTKIPNKLGLGLSFIYDNNLVVAADYFYQPWSKFERNGIIKSKYLSDLKRYSLGVEVGNQLKKYGSFWELVKYRCGLSYEESQYKINGEKINVMGLHAGISFPLGINNSIDLGFMYGIRGKTENNLLKENIFRISFSLNLNEMWFIRREW